MLLCLKFCAQNSFLPEKKGVALANFVSPYIPDPLLTRRKLLFLVVADVLIYLRWKLEIAIHIPAVRIVGLGQNREILLTLPLQNSFAAGWIVVARFGLAEHEGGLLFGEVFVEGEVAEDFLMRKEVAGDHGEDESAVVADVFAGLEGVEEVGHHGVFAEFGDAVGFGAELLRGILGLPRCFEACEFGFGGFGALGGFTKGL